MTNNEFSITKWSLGDEVLFDGERMEVIDWDYSNFSVKVMDSNKETMWLHAKLVEIVNV